MKIRACMACIILAAASVSAQQTHDVPPPAATGTKVVFSTSRRFVVQGLSAENAAAISQWTEEVAARLENLTGRSVPVKGHMPIELIPRNETGGVARVITAQGYVDGQVQQRLVMVNPGDLDQEDLLEGLCRLLLNRQVIALQSARQRTAELGSVPDWIAVGAAQTLYHEIRVRNSRMMLSRWKANQSFPLGAILGLQDLPGGRWNEKALCGLMMGWLVTWPDAHQRWGLLFERLAAGRGIDDTWLASSAAYGSARDMNKAWDVWLAQQCVQHDWARGPVERLSDLRQALRINPDDYGIAVEQDVAVPLAPAAMIDLRKRPWVNALTTRVALKIQWLGIGQPAELQAVVRGYVMFMDALAARPSAYRGGLFGRGPSESQLRKLLAEADAALNEYEKDAVQRKDYLDSVAARIEGTGAATWSGLVLPWDDPEDAERRAYLDGLEQKAHP